MERFYLEGSFKGKFKRILEDIRSSKFVSKHEKNTYFGKIGQKWDRDDRKKDTPKAFKISDETRIKFGTN